MKHRREGPASCGGSWLPGGDFISSNLAIAAAEAGFEEIVLPSLEPSSLYVEKAGEEILGQMYVFPDKKGRSLCLRPEGTATCQVLADTVMQVDRLMLDDMGARTERQYLGASL